MACFFGEFYGLGHEKTPGFWPGVETVLLLVEGQITELVGGGGDGALDGEALGGATGPEAVAAGVIEDVLGVGGGFHGGAVGDEEGVGAELTALLVNFFGLRGGFLNGHAVVVSLDAALGGAGMVAEDVGLGLGADVVGVFFGKGEADGDHVHFLFCKDEHVDLVLKGDAGGGHHFENLGVVVDVGNRRPDIGNGLDAHVFALLQDHAHVLEGVVGIEAGADEGFAFECGHDVFAGVGEGLLVGIKDGPHHGHGAHAIGAETGSGKGVDAVGSFALEKFGDEATSGRGDHDGNTGGDFRLEVAKDFLGGETFSDHEFKKLLRCWLRAI
jgi:hypothetical protein